MKEIGREFLGFVGFGRGFGLLRGCLYNIFERLDSLREVLDSADKVKFGGKIGRKGRGEIGDHVCPRMLQRKN